VSEKFRKLLQSIIPKVGVIVQDATVGVKMNYYHEQPIDSTNYITVVTYPVASPDSSENFMGTQRVDQRTKTFVIYRQTNASGVFPPTDGISIGDRLVDPTDTRNRWQIQNVRSDDLEIQYECECQQIKFKSTLPQGA